MVSSSPHSLVNRNVTITNSETGQVRRTSIRLEKIEWDTLRKICYRNKISIHEFCSRADYNSSRTEHSRTSRIRCAVLRQYILWVDSLESGQNINQQRR
ncbi:MAG: ribbon-helix-helix domain-containing protein [Sneathiella sp.]|nr:ribbon-helix-helix domain-containing protein [Sneathiella sp.]